MIHGFSFCVKLYMKISSRVGNLFIFWWLFVWFYDHILWFCDKHQPNAFLFSFYLSDIAAVTLIFIFKRFKTGTELLDPDTNTISFQRGKSHFKLIPQCSTQLLTTIHFCVLLKETFLWKFMYKHTDSKAKPKHIVYTTMWIVSHWNVMGYWKEKMVKGWKFLNSSTEQEV